MKQAMNINLTNRKKFKWRVPSDNFKENYKKMKKHLVLMIILFLSTTAIFSQSVAVSPSRLYYKLGLGEYKSQEVTVTNNSKTPQSFQVSFADFESRGNKGKTTVMNVGESEHSCSNWISATPSFFTLNPGETQKVKVLMQVPNTPDANKVKWAIMIVKLAREKKAPGEGNEKTVGFGIIQTFQFIIHIFQTPPTVTYKDAAITSFKEVSSDKEGKKDLMLEVKNTGEAILDCASYIELTNLTTGETQRLPIKAFSVLPSGERQIIFNLPSNLKSGDYSVLGVVDYGSKEKVEAAEMDISIP